MLFFPANAPILIYLSPLQIQVILYGGQVVSWKNDHREELLLTSSKVIFLFSLYHGRSFCLNVCFIFE
uniref:Uncharacterized protein n=1 Tax=Nelumbo nucifera TaxID=4432 RepID=A0A822ZU90_NELNU|nr:TPA_asm: hypothetical protein HUJ06_016796 [Nelumbo nucifera]